MAGRYVGELHTRVVGDHDAAPAYLPFARTLMGEVLEQAAVNNLGTYKLERRLRDGAVVVAEKVGGINRVTIIPPRGGGGRRPVRVFDDLIVGAGADGTENNVRTKVPIILSPGEGWAAYFSGNDAVGKAASTAARVGTYTDVFPQATKRLDILADGNCYHVNEGGRIVSWVSAANTIVPYGRHPRTLYGEYVNCLGRILLGSRQVLAASGYPCLLSATLLEDEGKEKKELLMVVADLDDLYFDDRPNKPSARYDVWSSPLYSDTPHPTALIRVHLREVEDPVSKQLYYKPKITDDDEIDADLLWAGTLIRGYNRWSYTPEGAFVSVQLPAQPQLVFDRTELREPLSSDEVIFSLSPSGLTTAPAGNVVTFDPQGVPVTLEPTPTGFQWACGDIRIPAYERTDTERTQSALEFVDAANNRAVTSSTWEAVTPLDSANDTVTAGRYSTAYDQGVATQIGEVTLPSRVSVAGYSKQMWDTIGSHLTGSGIAIASHAVYGVLISEDDPDDPDDDEHAGGAATIAPPSMAPAAVHFTTEGYAVGGASCSIWYNNDVPDWDVSSGFGPNNDVGFYPSPAVLSAVYVSGGFAAGKGYLAVSMLRSSEGPGQSYYARYITDGQLPGLTGGTFPRSMFFTPLGKPLLAQPRSTPV